MNIICNNCAGAAIYKYCLNTPYANPFIWCFSNLYDVMTNFYMVNWRNVRVYNDLPDLYGVWHINIDNKIDLKFVHALFDPNASKPTIDVWKIRYNRIWEYLLDKYIIRLQRMFNEHTEPIFINFIQNANDIMHPIERFSQRFISIAPSDICPDADIVYSKSKQLNPHHPVNVIKYTKTEVLNRLTKV